MKNKFIFCLCFFCLIFFNGYSQSPLMVSDTNDSSGQIIEKKPIVKKVVQLKSLKPEAGLEDYIIVSVENLDLLVKASKESRKPIILYFDEIPMNGIYADFTSVKDSSLIFKLTRDTVSLKSWNIFYQAQTWDSRKHVSVSVGFENTSSIETEVKDFALILVRQGWLIGALIGILILFVLFIILVKKTGIIKDDSFEEAQGYYSLARTQLAFWTFIIVFTFIYIWIVTGELPPVTGSTLILLTISIGTTVGSKLVDSSKDHGKPKHPEDSISDGFFKDLISDHSGVSIHRFQMVIWTLILGVFFIRAVLKNLAMPQFEESMLMLMGISSGAYVGLKIPEKSTTKTSTFPETNELVLDDNLISEEMPAVG